MTDPFVRLIVVSVVAGLVLAVAWLARRGVALGRRPVSIPAVGPGVSLFASSGCSSCERVMAALEEAGAGQVRVIDWDERPEVFLAAGIDRIPAIVSLDDSGSGWMVQGIPSARRLRRWLRDP